MYQDDEYREAARRMHGSPGVTVSPHAIVSQALGGAYVELRLWVPDAEAEAIVRERDFNAGRRIKQQ